MSSRSFRWTDEDSNTYASANRNEALRMKMPEYQRINLKVKVLRARLRFLKHITDPSDGVDHFPGEVFVHLVPQPADKNVHDVRLWVEAVVPHALQDHGLGDYLPGVAHQVFEQREFARLQVEFLTRPRDLP